MVPSHIRQSTATIVMMRAAWVKKRKGLGQWKCWRETTCWKRTCESCWEAFHPLSNMLLRLCWFLLLLFCLFFCVFGAGFFTWCFVCLFQSCSFASLLGVSTCSTILYAISDCYYRHDECNMGRKNHLGSWISLFFFAPVDFRLDFGFLSLDFGVWVLEFGFLDFGFGFGFWILEFGFWTVDSWILDLDCLPRFGLCIKYFQVTPTWVDWKAKHV